MKKMLTDRQIVEGLLWREERLTNQIVKQLYQANKNAIKQLVFKCGGSEADADDIFQEVIVIFLENVWQKKFSLQQAEISTYLYSIAKNVWFKRIKKEQIEQKYITIYHDQQNDNDTGDPNKIYIESEERETLSKLFDRLPKSIRDVLEAFYKDGLSMQEIMDKLKLPSVASTKMRKKRGFQEWRELLSQHKMI